MHGHDYYAKEYYSYLLYFLNIVENPTYGDIIDLFEKCESVAPADATYFSSVFKDYYPYFDIERPGRFYDTVIRIVAPTRPSIRSDRASLRGTQLQSYRKRVWMPRIRNKGSYYINVAR